MTRPITHLLSFSGALLFLGFTTSCTTPVVSEPALTLAKKRVAAEVGTQPDKGTLIIVDYTKPSSEKRLSLVDMKSGRGKMNSRVAHGVNSGLLYATDFSNQVGSEKSSLGLYELAEPYVGKHGRSFRLDGLDPGLNSNARRRAIVVHAADYATKAAMQENRHEYGRLGRSAGCLALSDKDLAKLDRKLERPVYVFAYAPMLAQNDYLPAPTTVPGMPTPVMPPQLGAPEILLASAGSPAPAPTPASAPVSAAATDLPAIPRPALIETGPVPPAPKPSNVLLVSRAPANADRSAR